MEEKIWLSSPHMGGNELSYIQSAFDENWIAPLGPNVFGFEKDLEDYLGEDSHVACLSTGTGAIHLALVLAGVQRDDEVICQTFTFCGSSNPIAYVGARPVFVDSELDTWNMCPHHLEEAIKDRIKAGKKPKAVIIVHLYGMPAKIDEITSVCKKYGIFLIEDAAEALGSTYKGRACGTFGDISILSFNGNKIITTSGGGALVCRDKATKERAIFLATQARDTAPHYQHSEIGYNYRMSNIVAGIGRGQMEILNKHVNLRRKNNDFYTEIFSNISYIEVLKEPSIDYSSNHWLSVILFEKEDKVRSRENLRIFLQNFNIESRPLWKPMHLQPIYNDEKYYGDSNSSSLFERGLCLPSGSNLTENQLDRVKKAIDNWLS
ncbi:MAG: dTDP-4-amino-4,6-dideoxygalactose transaminase [Flavobacteriaceae bacterium]|jgi:dTDP-4-amino-4,6-dideoxygalactose transaminase|uniref:DegT/DnrJ/EryC1/StrS family aminotransferase n=1 Tax=Candidatus Marifrigoribacter sp. Uisw_064 TaxID=3230970 RepID=UPI003AE121F7